MYLIEASGWLANADKHPSPNYNQRPNSAEISLLVIHNISLPAGHFGGAHVHELFTNCLDCSAHNSFAGLKGGIIAMISVLVSSWKVAMISLTPMSNIDS